MSLAKEDLGTPTLHTQDNFESNLDLNWLVELHGET